MILFRNSWIGFHTWQVRQARLWHYNIITIVTKALVKPIVENILISGVDPDRIGRREHDFPLIGLHMLQFCERDFVFLFVIWCVVILLFDTALLPKLLFNLQSNFGWFHELFLVRTGHWKFSLVFYILRSHVVRVHLLSLLSLFFIFRIVLTSFYWLWQLLIHVL